MKVNVTNILLGVLIVLFAYNFLIGNNEEEIIEDVTIVTEEKTGEVSETLEEIKETEAEVVYIKGDTVIKEVVIVDQEYKEKYQKAIADNDSLEAYNLYLKSIKIRTYDKLVVDNNDIAIRLKSKVRGELLSYSAIYTIKSDSITYTPEIIKVRPRATLLVGVEVKLPTVIGQDNIAFKVNLGLQNKKGNIYSIAIDTNQNIYIGYTIGLTLFK